MDSVYGWVKHIMKSDEISIREHIFSHNKTELEQTLRPFVLCGLD